MEDSAARCYRKAQIGACVSGLRAVHAACDTRFTGRFEGGGVSKRRQFAIRRRTPFRRSPATTLKTLQAPTVGTRFLSSGVDGLRVGLLAEAYAIHQKDLLERPLDFWRLTMERILLGAHISAVDLMQAQLLRRELSVEVNNIMLSKYNVLLATSSMSPAPKIDDTLKGFPLDWPMQIVGRYFDEATVFRVGAHMKRRSVGIGVGPNSPQRHKPHRPGAVSSKVGVGSFR
jgi:hypothetical protein